MPTSSSRPGHKIRNHTWAWYGAIAQVKRTGLWRSNKLGPGSVHVVWDRLGSLSSCWLFNHCYWGGGEFTLLNLYLIVISWSVANVKTRGTSTSFLIFWSALETPNLQYLQIQWNGFLEKDVNTFHLASGCVRSFGSLYVVLGEYGDQCVLVLICMKATF